jgi:Mce-associated membrane protein
MGKRARHRMPLRSQLGSSADAEVDKPVADATAEPTEEQPDAPRRPDRWRFFRRDAKATETQPESIDPTESSDEPADTEVVLVPHKPAGKRMLITAAAAGVLFVGSTAFAGAMVQPYLADRALVDTKLDVARTARDAITTLWTYTPDNMDSLPDRASRYLAGDFANEYRKYIDAIVAPNKQAKVTNTTEVMGAAVESISPSEATAIVYTNSVDVDRHIV